MLDSAIHWMNHYVAVKYKGNHCTIHWSEIYQVDSVIPPFWTTGARSLVLSVAQATLGSFSNDDGDGNQNVKKAIGLLRKTTTLQMHHAFLYISSLSLHDYDMKMPNCKFYGGCKQATTNLFFFL